MIKMTWACAALVSVLWMVGSAAAQSLGPETQLPLPRYVSLKVSEGNARRGPSLTHRIDWVYTRRSLPLRVVAEFGNWRRVEDADGFGGWVHHRLLSGKRFVLVQTDDVALLGRPDARSRPVAKLKSGVIARLRECQIDWCRVTADRYTGWLQKSDVWGVADEELRD